MVNPNIKTTKNVVPIIYAYTTPEIARHDGCTKIGDTERDEETRIGEQTNTADVEFKLEWTETAVYAGTFETFRDHQFHRALEKAGIERLNSVNTGEKTEWFRISPDEAYSKLSYFRLHKGIQTGGNEVLSYVLRDEQKEAVAKAVAYANSHPNGEFLWNAKPRFGKTLAAYEMCKKLDAYKVLIVTNRPAISTSWYSDYETFLGTESGYFFISTNDNIKDKKLVNDEFKPTQMERRIAFVSLQDLKGSIYFGGQYDKLEEVANLEWDVLIIDEAHEGVDTYKTDTAFDRIKRKFTLHLSGTPFKALSNEKFKSDAIYNWTYVDEQKRKEELKNDIDNPYASLPTLNMYTYQMSEIVKEKLKQGIEIQGETEEYAFDLGEFFKVKETSAGVTTFIYNDAIDNFLDALTQKEKYPFSTPELRDELKHTFWLLDRVESARALARKLEKHEIFKDYHIILAAGDGKIDDETGTAKSFDKVTEGIKKYDKTITLSVGQLTTGVTIPEWSAVLILSNITSPSLYMQAAFRAQNPWEYVDNAKSNGESVPSFKRKENAYVFDFDPARTLTVFEQFANNLNPRTSNGRGTLEQHQENIRELLNFFPVIGENDNGELVELDVEQVLTIPRKIRSQEVVRRGFMSNFLFNISNVFSIPKSAMDIINQLEPVSEKKGSNRTDIVVTSSNGFNVDDDGNVTATDDYLEDKTTQIFGDKKYTEIETDFAKVLEESKEANSEDKLTGLTEILVSKFNNVVDLIVAEAQESYGDEMRKSDSNQIKSQLNGKAEETVHKTVDNYKIKENILEKEMKEALQSAFDKCNTAGKTSEQIVQEKDDIEKKITNEYDAKKSVAFKEMQNELLEVFNDYQAESQKTTTKIVEEKKEQRRANSIMEDIRDRLRGFSRTIPSFIMAYGERPDKYGNPSCITLASFDNIVPDEVFTEVTSISLDQFRQLRDGFDYVDEETGEARHFDGNVFDQVVFDDSVEEFLKLKHKLADYFSDKNVEDIFDYIPPQKTNQIFTPKEIVKQMVDMLEEENPGCFEQSDKTFIDMYMKSGLYITEIVKRLYNSEGLKKQYPDEEERLKHIFEKQVYGLAPTEIIYNIATSYIFGFDENAKIETHNIRMMDTVPYVKDGTLREKLDELFGEKDK